MKLVLTLADLTYIKVLTIFIGLLRIVMGAAIRFQVS